MCKGRKKLKELAEISLGISFRSGLLSDEAGDSFLLQMKDLGVDTALDLSGKLDSLFKIQRPLIKAADALVEGDILFRSRGANFTAVIIEKTIKAKSRLQNVFPVSPLYLIRLRSEKLLPAYLLWFINNADTQKQLQQMSEGTQIKMLSKKNLDNLEIIIPSLEKQKKIVALNALFKKEKLLLENLIEKKKDYLDAVLRREIL